ncbi:MAG: hypothetical protein AAF715_30100 [Myxococcota bacterium]
MTKVVQVEAPRRSSSLRSFQERDLELAPVVADLVSPLRSFNVGIDRLALEFDEGSIHFFPSDGVVGFRVYKKGHGRPLDRSLAEPFMIQYQGLAPRLYDPKRLLRPCVGSLLFRVHGSSFFYNMIFLDDGESIVLCINEIVFSETRESGLLIAEADV